MPFRFKKSMLPPAGPVPGADLPRESMLPPHVALSYDLLFGSLRPPLPVRDELSVPLIEVLPASRRWPELPPGRSLHPVETFLVVIILTAATVSVAGVLFLLLWPASDLLTWTSSSASEAWAYYRPVCLFVGGLAAYLMVQFSFVWFVPPITYTVHSVRRP